MTGGPVTAGPGQRARRSPPRPRSTERVRFPDILRLAAWTGTLVVAARALHATGGALRVPTDSWRSAGEWVAAATPVDMAGAAVRLAAIAAVWYLLAATVVVLVADRAGRPGLVGVVAHLTPSLVRHTVVRGGGLGLAVGALVGSTLPTDAGPGGPGAPAPTLMSLLPAPPAPASGTDGTATMTRLAPAPGDPGEATMIWLPDDGVVPGEPAPSGRHPGSESPAATPGPGGPAAGASPGTAPPPRAAGTSDPGEHLEASTGSGDTWWVAPGDSFWSIATEVITEVAGARRPRDRDIAPYWRVLVAANRDRLVVPDDPDILLPGQQILVPAPPAAPGAT